MISEDDINAAYDNLESAYAELAKIEDKQTAIAEELAEFKEGSRKADLLRKRLQELQPKKNEAHRAYVLAGMKADRLRLLLDVAKTAKGRE